MGSTPVHRSGGSPAYHNEEETDSNASHHPLGLGGNRPPIRHPSSVPSISGNESYDINLSFEGRLVRHAVTPDMWVRRLRDDAAQIYFLVAQDLVLVLFGMHPHSLVIQNQLSDPPRVGPGSTVLIFNVRGFDRSVHPQISPTAPPPTAMSFPTTTFPVNQKFLGNFKLTKFDGSSRNWKQWDKSFVRFLSIHQLDQVIEESFLAVLPLSPQDFNTNKMVYYILEDALVPGSLAAKYFRQAAKWNGNDAYARLYDGYVFSGPQTMSLLLAELVNLRFKADESASGFCLRLREIFEDLEMVPGPSSITMNDTQKIGYVLTGIHQEKALQAVYVALQDKQLRGGVTFEEACDDLHHRCEAIRTDELLDTPVRGQSKALITTQAKRQNKVTSETETGPCLQKTCSELVKIYLPLCPLHYHQCVSGKTPEVELRDGLGTAKYNVTTRVIDYPSAVPKNRFPLPKAERPRKALAFTGKIAESLKPILVGRPMTEADEGVDPLSPFTTFYVDSGAGQCLCSCSSAFISMEACHLQVVGVSGRTNIAQSAFVDQGPPFVLGYIVAHKYEWRVMPANKCNECCTDFLPGTERDDIPPTRRMIHKSLPVWEAMIPRLESVSGKNFRNLCCMQVTNFPLRNYRHLRSLESPLRKKIGGDSACSFGRRLSQTI